MKLFLLVVVFLGLVIFKISGTGKTLVVSNRRAGFDSIQKAIDYASSGDTVRVFPGRYRGRVKIRKEVHLIGTDPKEVTLAAKGDGYFFNIGTDDFEVTLKNLSFAAPGGMKKGDKPSIWAIAVFGGTTLNIENCIIKEGFTGGIGLFDGTNARIKNNVIRASRTAGISASTRGKVTGSNNEIRTGDVPLSGNVPGSLRVKLTESKREEIVWPNDDYATFQHAVDALMPGGKLLINGGTYKLGATIDKRMTIKANSQARPLIARGSSGFYLVGGANLTIKGVTFFKPKGPAVDLSANAKARMVDCEVQRSNTCGVSLTNNSRLTVFNSDFSENPACGIGLQDSARALVKNSELSHNGRGIELNLQAEATLIGNQIHHNLIGIDPRSHYVPFRGKVRGYGNKVYRNKYNFGNIGESKQRKLRSVFPDSCPVLIKDPSYEKSDDTQKGSRCFVGPLQQAVEEADPGSKIILSQGKYFTNLKIDKALTLEAPADKDVTIVAREIHLPVINIGDSGNEEQKRRPVTINNLTIRGRQNLIPPVQKDTSYASGIRVMSRYHLNLANSTVRGIEGSGVRFTKCSAGTIENTNIIENVRGVMSTGYREEIEITDTTIAHNRREGVELTYWPSHSYCYNFPKETKVSIEDSVISDNGRDGLAVDLEVDVEVTNTLFKNNRIGLVASSSPVINLKGNKFIGNRRGVVLGPKGCSDVAKWENPTNFNGEITGGDNIFFGEFGEFICEAGYPEIDRIFERAE